MKKNNKPIANNEILSSVIALVDPDTNALVPMPTEEARKIAADRGLDLVVVDSEQAEPVCRLLDLGKLAYEKKKKSKGQKNQPKNQIKEVRLHVGTALHDLEIKAKKAIQFLQKGHQVKVSVRMKGRENARPEAAEERIQEFSSLIAEAGKTGQPNRSGKELSCMIEP